MLNISDIEVKQKISFEVYPIAQLGNVFQNVTYCGSFDAQLASVLNFDIAANHGAMYPSLPAGTPSDYTQYTYCRVQMPSGEFQILAHEWIRPGSVILAEGQTGTLKFYNINRSVFDKLILACRVNGKAPDAATLE